jgi:hypothetical protein
MTRAWWWLLGLVCLSVVAGIAVDGWWAGAVVGLPTYLIVLVGARAGLADRPPPPLPAPADPSPASWTPADRIAGTLSWSTGSGRLFDRVTRPLLQRGMRAALAGRGLDLDRDRDQIRQLLGEPTWYLLDPARPARDDSFTGGVDRATLAQAVTRLEELSR